MASYFDEIARNKVKSVALMVVFGAFYLLIIGVVALLLGVGGFGLTITLMLGALLLFVFAIFAYFQGGMIALKIARAQPADQKQYPQLFDIVEGLAASAQVPMPKIYIVNDPSPNAFATGRNKKHAYIAVTTGLLSMMNKNELEGVIAHEMSHVYDNDIQFMMLAIAFGGAIGLLAVVVRSMFFFGGVGNGRGRNEGALLIVGLVVGILAPLFALLIRLAISRNREYMADANGARMIRAPGYLANALQKIDGYMKNPQGTPVRTANEVTAPMYFSNPFKGQNVMSLFSTHPPTSERIKRLEKMY